MRVPCGPPPPEAPVLCVDLPSQPVLHATCTCRRLLCDPPPPGYWHFTAKVGAFGKTLTGRRGTRESRIPERRCPPSRESGFPGSCFSSATRRLRTRALCSGLIPESPSARVRAAPLDPARVCSNLLGLSCRPWSHSSRERGLQSLPCPEPGFLHAASTVACAAWRSASSSETEER